MINKLILLLILGFTITSCGTRSGVDHANENKDCGVTNESTEQGYRLSESEKNGQNLFDAQCNECHSLNKDQKCGNMMKGVCDRIPQGVWFKNFVQNSDSLKKAGDSYSLVIDKEWQYDFEHKYKSLSNKDLEDIYNYLKLW